MADVYSDVATIQQGGTLEKMLPSKIGGRVRAMRSVYVCGGTVVPGTKIHFGSIPAGARVLPISTVIFEAGQDANLTLKVGNAAKDDLFLAVTTVGADYKYLQLTADALVGCTSVGDIIAVTGGTANLTEGKKVVADIFYVID